VTEATIGSALAEVPLVEAACPATLGSHYVLNCPDERRLPLTMISSILIYILIFIKRGNILMKIVLVIKDMI
jgi:hypothetical protein